MQRSAIHVQNQIKKQHTTQNKSQLNPQDQTNISKRSNSVKFIPFLNQRDSIGRLIKKPSLNYESNSAQVCQMKKPFLSIKRSASLQPFGHVQGIQTSLNIFFKQNCVYKKEKGSPEKLKFKVHKKPSLQEFMIKPPIKIQVKLQDSFAQVIQSNQQLDNNQLAKSQSLELKRFDEISLVKKQIPLQKKYSLGVNIKPSSSTASRKLSKVSLTTKISKLSQNNVKVYNLQRLKNIKGIDEQLKNVKGKASDCQQLQRYRQMKKLGMNLFEDINEGHNLFLKKIKDSKQLAYKIKQELQS